MTKYSKGSWLVACLGLFLLAAAFSAASSAQEKPVDKKALYNEIAGNYDFDIQGQTMTINFFEKDGKLFGAPVGETPEEILPVQGNPLKFQVTPAGSGQLYELEFVRNDKKVIDKCILLSMGMVMEGKKQIKSES